MPGHVGRRQCGRNSCDDPDGARSSRDGTSRSKMVRPAFLTASGSSSHRPARSSINLHPSEQIDTRHCKVSTWLSACVHIKGGVQRPACGHYSPPNNPFTSLQLFCSTDTGPSAMGSNTTYIKTSGLS